VQNIKAVVQLGVVVVIVLAWTDQKSVHKEEMYNITL
jgi:hypothetical protein